MDFFLEPGREKRGSEKINNKYKIFNSNTVFPLKSDDDFCGKNVKMRAKTTGENLFLIANEYIFEEIRYIFLPCNKFRPPNC